MYLGCHLSAAKGMRSMVQTARSIGANTFAYFTRNPRGSRAKREDPADIQAAGEAMAALSFGPLVAHGSYTMNLSTSDPEDRAFAASVLAEDLARVAALPGNFYNFHPGSHVGQGTQIGIEQVARALRAAMAPGYPVTVLLETMAGKGSELGGRFEELRDILDAVGGKDLGVCLDTCHVWDAGYDIQNHLDAVLENPLGSRKDRHARIGEGYLGVETFRAVVCHPALKDLPMILETPNELPGYQAEIALLRGLDTKS